MAELKTHKSRIGKGLINMLMFQMYGDEKLIYREYVQNARDAINDAVNHGILGAITDGRISITIDSAKRFIEIRDNGIGIPVERVESVLLDIADSNKDGESSAGQFGIGRLVGGYFCKKLSFRTTYKGEEFASEIVFDINTCWAVNGPNIRWKRKRPRCGSGLQNSACIWSTIFSNKRRHDKI